MSKSLIEKGWFRTVIIIPAFFFFATIFQVMGIGVSALFSKLGIIDFSLADLDTFDNLPAMTIIQYFDMAGIFLLLWVFMKYVDKEPFKNMGFEIKGGIEEGKKFINALEMVYHVANIGDSRSLAIHPGSTTHSQLNEEELLAAGITPGYVRLSIGLEHADDIIADFEQALAKI